MLKTYRRESKTKTTESDIQSSTLAFNCRRPESNRSDRRHFVFLEITIFKGQNWHKNKWSSKKKVFSFCTDFALQKWCFQKKKKKKKEKKVFSRSGPSTTLVIWASFFGTVLFLVNENMVPLSIGVDRIFDWGAPNHMQ